MDATGGLVRQWNGVCYRNTKNHRFSEDLLNAIEGLDRWPDRVRIMQHNWIGKSKGARIT